MFYCYIEIFYLGGWDGISSLQLLFKNWNNIYGTKELFCEECVLQQALYMIRSSLANLFQVKGKKVSILKIKNYVTKFSEN